MDSTEIVLVEDDQSLLMIAEHRLSVAGYKVVPFTSGEDALNYISSSDPSLVLTDLILDGKINGDDLLAKIRINNRDMPVILMTANGTIESAVKCVKNGAWNYLCKPFHWNEMLAQIERALEVDSILKENIRLKQVVDSYGDYSAIVGESKVMINVKKQLSRMAISDAPILISGESGTGKELIARSIHINSKRRDHPFIAVNCGAIVKDLAESELFGHCIGAFTGATKNKKGYFLEANGGSIFLDEIGELPLNLQVKLLRVLQEQEVTPVGESKPININVRLISATHVDIENAIEEKVFREDLFYRISVLPIKVPPLRHRKGDFKVLVDLFLKKLGAPDVRFSKCFWNLIDNYRWPGNIRELENIITRVIVMKGDSNYITSKDLDGFFSITPSSLELPEEGIDLENHINELVKSALEKTNGNQTKAAKLLNISRSALIYRVQKYEIVCL